MAQVKYEDPLASASKTEVEIGELLGVETTTPFRLEKVLTAVNTEVFKFRGRIAGQPTVARTHHILVECTVPSEHGPVMTAAGVGHFEREGDLVLFEIPMRGPQNPGRHRLAIKIYRAFRDDGTVQPENELDSTVIAEGEIEVRVDDQKLTPVPDTPPSKR